MLYIAFIIIYDNQDKLDFLEYNIKKENQLSYFNYQYLFLNRLYKNINKSIKY